jgi:hypothetical protein
MLRWLSSRLSGTRSLKQVPVHALPLQSTQRGLQITWLMHTTSEHSRIIAARLTAGQLHVGADLYSDNSHRKNPRQDRGWVKSVLNLLHTTFRCTSLWSASRTRWLTTRFAAAKCCKSCTHWTLQQTTRSHWTKAASKHGFRACATPIASAMRPASRLWPELSKCAIHQDASVGVLCV